MRKEDLDILLDKYYNGETTPEEEQTLIDLFKSGDVPDGYDPEMQIFRFLSEESSIPQMSPGLSERIISSIEPVPERSAGNAIRRWIYQLGGIAAVLLIAIASWFYFYKANETPDTFDDPALAYSTAMKVLYDVSSRLNEGAVSLQQVSKLNSASLKSVGIFEEKARLAGQNLRNLGQINRTIELTTDQE